MYNKHHRCRDCSARAILCTIIKRPALPAEISSWWTICMRSNTYKLLKWLRWKTFPYQSLIEVIEFINSEHWYLNMIDGSCKYYTILGTNFLTPCGIHLNYETGTMERFDSTLAMWPSCGLTSLEFDTMVTNKYALRSEYPISSGIPTNLDIFLLKIDHDIVMENAHQ